MVSAFFTFLLLFISFLQVDAHELLRASPSKPSGPSPSELLAQQQAALLKKKEEANRLEEERKKKEDQEKLITQQQQEEERKRKEAILIAQQEEARRLEEEKEKEDRISQERMAQQQAALLLAQQEEERKRKEAILLDQKQAKIQADQQAKKDIITRKISLKCGDAAGNRYPLKKPSSNARTSYVHACVSTAVEIFDGWLGAEISKYCEKATEEDRKQDVKKGGWMYRRCVAEEKIARQKQTEEGRIDESIKQAVAALGG